jgi:cytochrome c oxidase assembly protein subunit 11
MQDLERKNRKILGITFGVVAGMILLAYASVPLYMMLCKVTGWGGTTREVVKNESKIVDRKMTVRFDSGVARNMPWSFQPDLRQVQVKVGQDGIISFLAKNDADIPVTGTAVYNVTPLKAGKYFYKTQCFCFGEQTLRPGETVHMPVTFFIDPKIMEDREMDDVHTITLSYTFFRQSSPELEKATEKFYNENSDIRIN